MTIYHGTDARSAEKIVASKALVGTLTAGPGVCIKIEQAIEYAGERSMLVEKSRRNAKVVVIEGLPDQLINNASKSTLSETYTLNDELGKPAVSLPFTKIKIMSIKDAEALCNYKKIKIYNED